jgi:hypothetical protein
MTPAGLAVEGLGLGIAVDARHRPRSGRRGVEQAGKRRQHVGLEVPCVGGDVEQRGRPRPGLDGVGVLERADERVDERPDGLGSERRRVVDGDVRRSDERAEFADGFATFDDGGDDAPGVGAQARFECGDGITDVCRPVVRVGHTRGGDLGLGTATRARDRSLRSARLSGSQSV